MAVLHIRDVPNPIYQRVQAIAAGRGLTLSTHVIHLLEADVFADEAKARHHRMMLELHQRAYVAPAPDALSTVDILHELRGEGDFDLP